MGVQKNIKELQGQVEILGGALTRALKTIQALETLCKGTLTAFQLHIGEEEWKKVFKQLQEREQESKPKEKKLELDVE